MALMENRTERVGVGCMTGTSLDGLDAVAVLCRGRGLDLGLIKILGASHLPLPESDTLAALAGGEPVDAASVATAADALGRAHADAVEALVRDRLEGRPDLVVLHGQTVFHDPPRSWQLINPWAVAARIGCPVVFDLRGADLAAGGQGAPITPLADWVLFRDGVAPRAIVNLGGFCNITLIPASARPEDVRGFDVCVCNRLLDHGARRVLGRPYDEDGRTAGSGTIHREALDDLCAQLIAQGQAHRSLGSGDDATEWLDRWGERLSPADLLGTAAAAIGAAVRELLPGGWEVYLAGGGVRNRALTRALGDPPTTGDLAVEPQHREAAGLAVLGLLAGDGIAVTLPAITGRRDPVPLSGAWITPATVPAS